MMQSILFAYRFNEAAPLGDRSCVDIAAVLIPCRHSSGVAFLFVHKQGVSVQVPILPGLFPSVYTGAPGWQSFMFLSSSKFNVLVSPLAGRFFGATPITTWNTLFMA